MPLLRGRLVLVLVGLFSLTGLPAPAPASSIRSAFTTIDLARCTPIAGLTERRAWRCPGLSGYQVYLAEHQQRVFVSVGSRPEARRAATQSPAQPNTIFAPETKTKRATIEWRVRQVGEALVPHATILRYYIGGSGQRSELIVVMRVSEHETCHVAHIDALAEKKPMLMARQFADGPARDASCPPEASRIGREAPRRP